MPPQIKQVSQEQRWAAITKGQEEHKSQRTIAKELHCDEATVRREISKMALPKNFVEAIKQGHPAEPLLRQMRAAEAIQNGITRLQQEQVSGRHSTAAATAVVKWLLDKELGDWDTMYVLTTLRGEFSEVGDKTREKACLNPAHLLASLESQAKWDSTPEKIEDCMTILRQALPKVTPEKMIRDGAFPKMIAAVKEAKRRRPIPFLPRRPWNTARACMQIFPD
jgi:hypothetical protein